MKTIYAVSGLPRSGTSIHGRQGNEFSSRRLDAAGRHGHPGGVYEVGSIDISTPAHEMP